MRKFYKQKGATLFELVLALALFGIVLVILVKYMQEKARFVRLQTTAHQMEKIADDATTYVERNFTKLYQEILVAGGVITLDLADVYDVSSSDLISYTGDAPFSEDYKGVIRITYDVTSTNIEPDEKSLQVILYAINDSQTLTWMDARQFARIIKNAQGGIVYGVDSTFSPCVSALKYCIENPYGVWQIENAANTPIVNADISTDLDVIISSADTTLAPAVVAVSNITETQATSPFVSRSSHPNNRSQNTIETDINLDTTATGDTSIMFNGTPELDGDGNPLPNSLLGTSLTFYEQKGASCAPIGDTDGDGDEDDDDEQWCSYLTQPSLLLESLKPDMLGGDEAPIFRSSGGLKTNLKVIEGTLCDVALYKRIIAVDESSGHLLRCYENENYQYETDIDDDEVIDAAFTGDWKKLDWKKSFIFLSNMISLASGNGEKELTKIKKNPVPKELEDEDGNRYPNPDYTSNPDLYLGDAVGNIIDDAQFLFLEVTASGSGTISVIINGSPIVPGSGSTFEVFSASPGFVSNSTKQVLVPLPETDTGRFAISVVDASPTASIGSWSISVVGYAR